MKVCIPVKYFHGFTWMHELTIQIHELFITTSLQELLRQRDEARKKYRKQTYNFYMLKIIDDINMRLNRIRINETPLCPAIFARSSYSVP